MFLRTLTITCIAASLLAGCSGGSSGVLATGAPAASTPQSAASFSFDASRFTPSSLKNNQRGSQYVPADNTISGLQYAFVGGTNPSGTLQLALPDCTASSNSGSGIIYTCTIPLPPATYGGLTLTLKAGTTTLGTGLYSGAPFIITAGNLTAIGAIAINPTLHGPGLSIITGQRTAFYMENSSQSIALAANELDPDGNIITTFYGPVANWLPLTATLGGGTTGVFFYGGVSTIPVVPTAQTGSTITVAYPFSGLPANGTSLTVTLTDNVNTNATVTIPFVSFSTTAPGNAINVSSTNANFSVTETATSGSVPDANFVSSSNCLGNITVVPGLGLNAISFGANTGQVGYTVTHAGVASGTCTLTVKSENDSLLLENITVTY